MVRRVALAAVFAAVLAAGSSVFLAPAVLAAAPAEISIAGRVLGPGGSPLAEAEVLLLPTPDPVAQAKLADTGALPKAASKAVTDAQGRYALGASTPGLFKVRVQASGYVPAEIALEPLIEPIDLPDAEMAVDAGLAVKVVGSDGKPLAGARIRLTPPESAAGARSRMFTAGWRAASQTAVSDANGVVRLLRNEKGISSLTAWAPGYLPQERRNVRGTATIMKLEPGTEQRLKVVGVDKAPIPGVLLVASDYSLPVGFTDAQGAAGVSVAAGGRLALDLYAPDGRRSQGQVNAPPPAKDAKAAPPAPPKTFTLGDRLAAKGRVIDARTRAPLSGALVWVSGELWGAAVTDAAGGYMLRGASGRTLEILGGAPGYLRPDPASYFFTADIKSAPTLALKPGAAIEGIVVDETGQPVAGADASLSVKQDPGRMIIRMGAEPPAPRAVSSSHGSFRISPVDPEKGYDLKVAAPGFAPQTKDILGLEARRTMSGVRIEMSRGQSVAGQILDKDGKPVRDADASLRVASRGPRLGGMMIEGPGGGGGGSFKASSDTDGKFRITGVSAGTYDLEIRHGGYAVKSVPGIEVPKKPEPVDVGSISLEPGARVNGLVSAPDGSPIEGVEIAIMKASAGPVMMAGRAAPGTAPAAVTGADGRFALDDLEGGKPINLSFSRAGWVRKTESGIEPPRTDPVLVTLEPASKVSGRVLGPDKKPIPGAVVNLTRTQSGGIGNQAFKMIMRDSDNADDDGFFLFDNVSPGQIALGAVASGWQEAKLDGVEVPQGKDVTGLEIPLKAGSVVAGRVLGPDGRPAIGARVGLVKDDPEPLRLDGVFSDGDGNYRVEGLVPGTFSIEATHDDFVRTVKEIVARPGTNKLDLQFEGGQEVAGSVTDAAGTPIAGVLLALDAPGRDWGGPEAHSAGDGGFKFLGVGDGDYTLRATREGFAPLDQEVKVHVAGKPVAGLKLQLGTGVAIAGTISGIAAETLPSVEVRAFDGRGHDASATPDRKGAYKLAGILPGTWNVTASIASSGQQTRGQVVVEPGSSEARLDLQFGGGLTLSGHAVQGDQPVKGAVLYARGTNVDHSGWGRTDADGAFRMEGLEPGTYTVELRVWETGLSYDQSVELTSSKDVTLTVPTARVIGRIVDGADRRPIAGVALTLGRPGENTAVGPIVTHGATSDLNGRFELANVSDGQWTINAAKTGYAAGTSSVNITGGHVPDELTIALDSTEGLSLDVHLPTGRVPDSVDVAVLNASGSSLLAGTYATGENGRVRLSTIPPGRWELVVSAGGSGVANVTANVPGPALAVQLPPACGLKVTVPALAGTNTTATAKIQGADGRTFRSMGWMADATGSFRLAGGQLELDTLPPGTWNVQVAASDGRTWNGTSQTQPGTRAEVTLQ